MSDGGLDPDGDGQTNANEFNTATNPRDHDSRFGIVSVQRNESDVRIDFGLVVPGRIYRLLHSTNLQGSWQLLGALSPAFTGSEVFHHAPGTQRRRFTESK